MNDRVGTSGQHFTDTILCRSPEENRRRGALKSACGTTGWSEMAADRDPAHLRLKEALQAQACHVFSLNNFGIQSYDLRRSNLPFCVRSNRDFFSGHMGHDQADAWRSMPHLKETCRPVQRRRACCSPD